MEDKNIVRLLGGIPLFDDTLPFYTCVYAKKVKFGLVWRAPQLGEKEEEEFFLIGID